MKLFICITLSIISLNSFSQTGFYFKPLIEKTINYNKTPFKLTIYNSDGLPITIQNKTFIKQRLQLGIYVGYKFRKLSLESGVIGFNSASGISLSYFQYDSLRNQYTSNFGEGGSGGMSFLKVPLRANYTLFKTDSTKKNYTFLLDLNLGLDMLFGSKSDPNTYQPLGSVNYITSKDGQTIEVSEWGYKTQTHFSYMPSIGLTFKLNKKKTNVLNFTFLYSKGIDPLSEERIIITQPNATAIVHSEYSNGSGFYLSLSREFYLSNYLDKRKKRTQEKFEKFKKQN